MARSNMRFCASSPVSSAPCRSTSATGASAWCWRRLAPLINPKRHKRALANLALAFPEKSEAERQAIALGTGRTSAASWSRRCASTASWRSPSGSTSSARTSFPATRTSSAPRSASACTWATGSWRSCRSRGPAPIPAAVYRSVTNPYVDAYIRRQRKDLYPDGLFGRGNVGRARRRSANGARDHGLRATRRPARARMRPLRPHGHAGAVFRAGRQDASHRRYDRASRRRPHLAARCEGSARRSRFEIEIKELRVPRTENKAEDIRWTMVEMQKQFEAWIREAPSNGCGATDAGASRA